VWALDLAGRTSGKPGQAAGGIDGLVAVSVVSNGVTRLYLPIMDHQGTVRHVVDAATGRIVADFDYTPYGELVTESGDPAAIAAVPFRFQTKYYDRESGLLYFGHRYYAPSTGKWLTRDPLGEKGGLNLTQAFSGDPVNGVDAVGLRAYGNNYKGEVDRMFDWVEPNYTQDEVDSVYAVLAARDRHLYNPGLNNEVAYRNNNRQLLERILGVPVNMVNNWTFSEPASRMEAFGESLQIPDRDRPQMFRWPHREPTVGDETKAFVGGIAKVGGGVLGLFTTALDFVMAGYDKVGPGDSAVADTKRKGAEALNAVKKTRGVAHFWMHSEGAIHGRTFLNRVAEEDLPFVQGYTFGAGSMAFNEGVRVRHHGCINIRGERDPVPMYAALDVIKKNPNVVWQKNVRGVSLSYSSCQPEYVHGFPTYAYYFMTDLSKNYFHKNAKEILGK
jgi:RHS repeat-associated protein